MKKRCPNGDTGRKETIMTLEEAKRKNDEIFYKWLVYGRPEAFTELNDSNRDLIRAYLEENPNAVGYRFSEGIVELRNNPLYNFCCDIILDRSLAEKIKTMKPTDFIGKVLLNQKDTISIVWS